MADQRGILGDCRHGVARMLVCCATLHRHQRAGAASTLEPSGRASAFAPPLIGNRIGRGLRRHPSARPGVTRTVFATGTMLTDPPWDVPRLIWVLVLEPRSGLDRSSQVVTQASEQEIRWLPAGVDDVVPHPGGGKQEVSDLITTRWLSVGDWPRVGLVARRTCRRHQHRAFGPAAGAAARTSPCAPASPQSVPAHQRDPLLNGRERVSWLAGWAECDVPHGSGSGQAGTHLLLPS